MSTKVQHRRGNNSEINNNVPATGEIWYNTDTKALHVGDDSSKGGKVSLTDESIWGERYIGTFASGFTYNSDIDVARAQDGKYYRYTGNGSYPIDVEAGTVPSDFSGLYSVTNSNNHTDLVDRNIKGAHNASSIITADSRSVQERLDDLPSEVDAAGTAEGLIDVHNSDMAAHPELLTQISNLEQNQTTGVIVFTTYALLDAYIPADATEQKASYKVTNDPDSSLNGYYHWVSGTTYEKDADLVLNTIDENNTSDAVSGAAVYDVTNDRITKNLLLNQTGGKRLNPTAPIEIDGVGVTWSAGGGEVISSNANVKSMVIPVISGETILIAETLNPETQWYTLTNAIRLAFTENFPEAGSEILNDFGSGLMQWDSFTVDGQLFNRYVIPSGARYLMINTFWFNAAREWYMEYGETFDGTYKSYNATTSNFSTPLSPDVGRQWVDRKSLIDDNLINDTSHISYNRSVSVNTSISPLDGAAIISTTVVPNQTLTYRADHPDFGTFTSMIVMFSNKSAYYDNDPSENGIGIQNLRTTTVDGNLYYTGEVPADVTTAHFFYYSTSNGYPTPIDWFVYAGEFPDGDYIKSPECITALGDTQLSDQTSRARISKLNYDIKGKFSGKFIFGGDSMMYLTPQWLAAMARAADVSNYENLSRGGIATDKLTAYLSPIKDRGGDNSSIATPSYAGVSSVFIMIGYNGGITGTIADITSVSESIYDIPYTPSGGSLVDTVYKHLDRFPNTYYGNLGLIIEYIRSENADTEIYLITPPPHFEDGSYVVGIATAMQEIADQYNIRVLDGLRNCNYTYKENALYTYDGIHFNPSGYTKWGKIMSNLLLNS